MLQLIARQTTAFPGPGGPIQNTSPLTPSGPPPAPRGGLDRGRVFAYWFPGFGDDGFSRLVFGVSQSIAAHLRRLVARLEALFCWVFLIFSFGPFCDGRLWPRPLSLLRRTLLLVVGLLQAWRLPCLSRGSLRSSRPVPFSRGLSGPRSGFLWAGFRKCNKNTARDFWLIFGTLGPKGLLQPREQIWSHTISPGDQI